MAQYLQVTYEVVDNLENDMDTFTSQVTLNNTGRKTVPGAGWAIFFSQRKMVEPFYYPYPNAGRLIKRYSVRFRHLQGGFFSVEPDEGFGDIASGDSRVIQFTSATFSVARTDAFPNWYLAGLGLEPRTLVSTVSEDMGWVGEFDTENKWKRYEEVKADGTSESSDRYEPYNAESRYEVNTVDDLGGPVKHVIPTPADIKVTRTSYVQLDTKDWVVYNAKKFPKEERMVAERLGLRLSAERPASHVILFRSHDPWWSVGDREIGGPEAYTLIVDPSVQVIEIKAHSSPGAFYGVMSLLNLMDEQFRRPR
ncbi:putative beta-hexosaminidase [Babylonia areolata]|uniref:putative beta-hexosaminidase n=1 Tax=Babylonia areolata TaxID=304850 RepID=UPI003FD388B1